MKLTCRNCQYSWDYRGKSLYWATCPRCLRKVSLRKPRVGIQLLCPYCSYKWYYRGRAYYWATCPMCFGKVNLVEKVRI